MSIVNKEKMRRKNRLLGLLEYSLMGVILFVLICIILLPVILTLIVGMAFANYFGFTGLTWWAFMILFYLIVSAIIGTITL